MPVADINETNTDADAVREDDEQGEEAGGAFTSLAQLQQLKKVRMLGHDGPSCAC